MSKCFWSASESPRPCEVKPVYRLTVGHNSEGGTEKRPTGAGSGDLVGRLHCEILSETGSSEMDTADAAGR